MSFSGLIKQPWFQAICAIVLVIIIGLTIYFYGKSAGRYQAETKFEKRQAELLQKAQQAMQEADKQKAIADSTSLYAEKLRIVAEQATAKARENEDRITQVYTKEQQEIKEKYEADKKYITSDLSDCERCRDLCQRSNALVNYGPEFASAKCDANTACADICNTK